MNMINKKASKYIKEKLTESIGQIGNQTIVVRGFNTLFSEIYSKKKQKISKDIEDLNNTIKHLDTYIYIIDYAKSSDYIFFSSAHCAFTKRDHILLVHKTVFIN